MADREAFFHKDCTQNVAKGDVACEIVILMPEPEPYHQGYRSLWFTMRNAELIGLHTFVEACTAFSQSIDSFRSSSSKDQYGYNDNLVEMEHSMSRIKQSGDGSRLG